jgi:hypothetical protein
LALVWWREPILRKGFFKLPEGNRKRFRDRDLVFLERRITKTYFLYFITCSLRKEAPLIRVGKTVTLPVCSLENYPKYG